MLALLSAFLQRHFRNGRQMEKGQRAQQQQWTARHKAMARHIMKRYGLLVPRDRELIRQLANIFVQQRVKVRDLK